MVGIISYGAYIPFHRLSHAEITRAWGIAAPPGERSVAYFDEDVVTMAVAAATDCLRDVDNESIDAILFATTTSPYTEKLGAAIIAAALDLRGDVLAMDITNTLRAGTSAIYTAVNTVKAGAAKNVLVAIADCRLGSPASEFEYGFGDGAAAFVIGEDNVVAAMRGSHTLCDEFSGVWRSYGDTFVRSWEDRMVLDEGYSRKLPEAMEALIQKCDLKVQDFSRVIYDGPTDLRRHKKTARDLRLELSQVQDPMLATVGSTGAAMAPMMMVAGLEEAEPGNNLLLASYGNGADALWFEVTPHLRDLGYRRGVRDHLNTRREVNNYETYLRWRGIITAQSVRRPEREPVSLSALWRARKEILGLCGVRCGSCGTPQYSSPSTVAVGGSVPSRVCVICQAKDSFEVYRFADKKGTVTTFTHDFLAASLDPPSTNAVVDFDGGGRGAFEVTDRDPDEVRVGLPVEMTFRKLFFDRGIHNYYWKATPLRSQRGE